MKLDRFEFKATRPSGEVVYSTATQVTLPPLADEFETIEQVNHYENGATAIITLKERQRNEGDTRASGL